MAMQTEKVHAEDEGLLALWLFLRLHGVNAAMDKIRDRCGPAAVNIGTMLRCAGQFGLGVRSRTTDWQRLTGMPLPGIASLRARNPAGRKGRRQRGSRRASLLAAPQDDDAKGIRASDGPWSPPVRPA